jgi:hypothetical protein
VLNLEEWMDIKALRKEGHSIKVIARLCGSRRVFLWRDAAGVGVALVVG